MLQKNPQERSNYAQLIVKTISRLKFKMLCLWINSQNNKLKKYILAIFNIEEEESLSVSLLMIQSLFIGIFNGTFYISSHTLFIGSYGGKSIPLAYLISGGVGIVLTIIYSKFQGSIKFASLSKINLIFVAIITIGLAFSYSFIDKKIVDYAQFVLFGPLFVLSIVSFWGIANRLYNLRQGKRLFGIIDAGIIFGIIISNIAVATIPYLIDIEIDFASLLFVSAGCTVATVLIQFLISANFNLDKTEITEEVEEEISGLKIMLQNKYVLMMATFAGLSMLIAFFVQYSFLLVLAKKYTNEIDFGSFLGAFTAIIMVFTLLLKTFVYSKLIKNYGLKTCLVLLPILLGGFTIAAIAIGYGMGIEDIESSGFLFFFMLIALSKLIAQAIKEGIELPSFKLIYQTLNKKIRFIIQAQIDGTVNEFSALLSGLCLVGLAALSFIGLVEISVVMLIVIVFWLYIAFSLYSRYKESLESGLKVDTSQAEQNFITPIANTLLNKINHSKTVVDPNLIISLHAIDPVLFEKEINTIKQTIKSTELQALFLSDFLKYPSQNHLETLTHILKNPASDSIKNQATTLITEIKATYAQIDYQKIISLSNAKNNKDRITAALMIRSKYETSYDTIILRLIKDPNLAVKIEVIKTCGLLGKIDFTPILIEYLADDELYSAAYSAIKALGENAIDYLAQAYFKSNISDKSLIVVTELISFINTEQADQTLMKKLFSKNRLIMGKAARGITAKRIIPTTEKETIELINLLNEQIAVVAWNYAAANAYQVNHPEMTITIDAINDDISLAKEILFAILSIIYDSNSVDIVKEKIESGDPDNISYAIEMLDLFTHEHIKSKLFPVLDDSQLTARILLLEDYFPIEIFRTENVFDLILNRDSNFISDWTKASVIYELDLSENEITQTFLAQLFNPKRIIRETAYYKMAIVNLTLRNSILNRFSEQEKFTLTEEIESLSKEDKNLIVISLLKLKEVINHNTFRPMNWVADIPHVASGIVELQNEVILKENSIHYLLRNTNKIESCNIINHSYSGLQLNDRVISVNKTVFNKIASHKLLTSILLSNN